MSETNAPRGFLASTILVFAFFGTIAIQNGAPKLVNTDNFQTFALAQLALSSFFFGSLGWTILKRLRTQHAKWYGWVGLVFFGLVWLYPASTSFIALTGEVQSASGSCLLERDSHQAGTIFSYDLLLTQAGGRTTTFRLNKDQFEALAGAQFPAPKKRLFNCKYADLSIKYIPGFKNVVEVSR